MDLKLSEYLLNLDKDIKVTFEKVKTGLEVEVFYHYMPDNSIYRNTTISIKDLIGTRTFDAVMIEAIDNMINEIKGDINGDK